jgi:hypothetical protein
MARGGGGAAAGGLAGWADEDHDAAADDDIPRRGRGLSGSYADRVASDTGGAGIGGLEPDEEPDEAVAETPVGAMSEPPPARIRERDPGRVAAFDGNGEGQPPQPPRHERRRDSDAPEWERARPQEVFPTLRTRRLPELSVPPLLVAVVAVALAAAVLFALPGLLGFGNPSAVASPTPSVLPSAAASLAPTAVPAPTPHIYIVQSGDTMSRIAKKFSVPLADLIAANAENIPDPDKLQIGDQVIIPVPIPSELPAASQAPAGT